mmetsp:Transcript_20079/g.46790  ORF Transcript_20079/g.46790 Transcript_20079/m.46790 type:complete len:239 (-) Transcript_20079:1-717(-)
MSPPGDPGQDHEDYDDGAEGRMVMRDAQGRRVSLPVHYFQSAPVQSVLTYLAEVQTIVGLAECVVPTWEQERYTGASMHPAFTSALTVIKSPGVQHSCGSGCLLPSVATAAKIFSEGLQQQQHVGLNNFRVNSSGSPISTSVVQLKAANMGQQMATIRHCVDIVASEDTVLCSGHLPKKALEVLHQEREKLSIKLMPLTVPICCSRLMEPAMYRSHAQSRTAPRSQLADAEDTAQFPR